MARTGYQADLEIQQYLFGEADMELFSAAQITDLLEADFLEYAFADAAYYLGAPEPEDGLRLAA